MFSSPSFEKTVRPTPFLVAVFAAFGFLTACADGASDDAGQVSDDDAGTASGCVAVDGQTVILDGGRTLTLSSTPAAMPLNELMVLNVALSSLTNETPPDDLDLAFTATMPAHGHGMNTTAVIEKEDATTFQIEGVQLHMPGTWLLTFAFTTGGADGGADLIYDDGALDIECAE